MDNFEDDLINMWPRLLRNALAMTHNQDSAEDLVQTTYVKALKAHKQFMPGTNLHAWLTTIMKNEFFTQYRKSDKRQEFGTDDITAIIDGKTFGGISPQEGSLLGRDLMRALNMISPDKRKALLLSTIGGKAHEEIAGIMGCEIGTVKSRISRARVELKHAMNGTHPGNDISGHSDILNAPDIPFPTEKSPFLNFKTLPVWKDVKRSTAGIDILDFLNQHRDGKKPWNMLNRGQVLMVAADRVPFFIRPMNYLPEHFKPYASHLTFFNAAGYNACKIPDMHAVIVAVQGSNPIAVFRDSVKANKLKHLKLTESNAGPPSAPKNDVRHKSAAGIQPEIVRKVSGYNSAPAIKPASAIAFSDRPEVRMLGQILNDPAITMDLCKVHLVAGARLPFHFRSMNIGLQRALSDFLPYTEIAQKKPVRLLLHQRAVFALVPSSAINELSTTCDKIERIIRGHRTLFYSWLENETSRMTL